MELTSRRGRSIRLWVLLAAALAGSGVLLSSLAVLTIRRNAEAAAAAELDRRTELIGDAMAAETRRYVDTLRLVADEVGSYTTFTTDKFARGTAALPEMQLAGATAIAFVAPPVDGSRVAEVQRFWRQRGADGLVLAPRGNAEHVFVIASTALDGEPARSAGVDITQATAPYAALLESRASDRVTVSDTYQLIIDRDLPADQRQMSFSLVAPAWHVDATGRRALRGWVLMGIRGQDFAEQVLARSSQGLADVTLSAQDAARRPVRVSGLTAPVTGERDLRRAVTLRTAQRDWTLTVSAVSARLSGGSDPTAALVGWGGSTMALLLAALVLLLGTGRQRAAIAVEAATAHSRRAEAEAREAEAGARRQAGVLSAVLESIGDAVGVVDGDGEFLLHNHAATTLLGVGDPAPGPDRAGPQDWQAHYGMFTPDGDRPFPTEDLPLVRALAGESTDDVEILICNRARPEGVLISVSGRPLDPAAGQVGAVAVFRDVTAERSRQAELEAFAAVAAHDLRTPLTVVAGYAELIASDVLDRLREAGSAEAAERTGHYLDVIREYAFAGSALVEDLLGYASAGDAPLELTDVDLGPLVDEVLAVHRDRLTALGAAVADDAPDAPGPAGFFVGRLPVVRGDRARLRQVLDNLVGNAVKYSRPGQPVRVDVTARLRRDGTVEVDAAGLVHLEVADRGIGIPPGQHAKVFGAFQRGAGHAQQGSGLGLAICQRTVERHGGTIAAADNPGGGTRVLVTLPAAGPVPAHDPDAVPALDREPAPASTG